MSKMCAQTLIMSFHNCLCSTVKFRIIFLKLHLKQRIKRNEFYNGYFLRYLQWKLCYQIFSSAHASRFYTLFLASSRFSYPKMVQLKDSLETWLDNFRLCLYFSARDHAWRLFSLVRFFFFFSGQQSWWSFDTLATHLSKKRTNISK